MSSTLDGCSRIIICQHCQPKAGGELLEKILPSDYNHLLCVNELSDTNEDYFRVHLKVKLSTEEQVDKWLQDLQYSSSLTWRIARTYPESGRYNTYRVDLRCQYKTYSRGKQSRNTNCPATMFLVLKRHVMERTSRSTDPHTLEGYYLYVNWRNQHNHPWASDSVLSPRNVSATTFFKLTGLYEKGQLPLATLDSIQYDLQEEQLYYVINEASGACHQVIEEGTSDCKTGTAEQSAPEESPESLERQLDDIVGLIKSKLREDTKFTAPVKLFVSNFRKLKTDGALKSALLCFGTTSNFASQVHVQATPRSSQQGRRLGRPRKSSRREHPYTKQGRAKNAPRNPPVAGTCSMEQTQQ